MSAPLPPGGFSLFPSTGRPPSRTQGSRPYQRTGSSVSPISRTVSPESIHRQAHHQDHHQDHQDHHRQVPVVGEAITSDVPIERPAPVADIPHRSDMGQPEPRMPTRTETRSSIAKVRLSLFDEAPPLDDPPPPMPGPSTAAPQYSAQAEPQRRQQQHRPPALQSIFPQYNPEVPLDQQEYYPTQTSPRRIPRGVISRPLYSPTLQEEQAQLQPQSQHPQDAEAAQEQQRQRPRRKLTLQTSSAALAGAYSPPNMAAGPSTVSMPAVQQPASWPAGWTGTTGPTGPTGTSMVTREAPSVPVPSTTEELRGFWKVANGWKAGPSEGRVFCMRMMCDVDAPVYRLLSASQQPLFRMRVNPTSVSAYVTLSRHDPARPFKRDGGNGSSGSNEAAAAAAAAAAADAPVAATAGTIAADAQAQMQARLDGSKYWQTTLMTTLEEEARRHQPHDGLVALLYPQQAARMALEQPDSPATVAAAERECARLVWDDDTSRFFLVHPVLALPFCVSIERSAAWSRTAYTLEHLESPQHLARLTRDATGAGWLEFDTGIASKIDAVYLADVAVAALLLVAHNDAQFAQTELFAPPPLPPKDVVLGPGGRSSSARGSFIDMVRGGGGSVDKSRHVQGTGKAKKSWRDRMTSTFSSNSRDTMEEFELDLESQTSIDLAGKTLENAQRQQDKNKNKNKKKRRRHAGTDDDEKMPGCLRLVTALFKCVFWCAAIIVRTLLAIASGLFRCLTSRKL